MYKSVQSVGLDKLQANSTLSFARCRKSNQRSDHDVPYDAITLSEKIGTAVMLLQSKYMGVILWVLFQDVPPPIKNQSTSQFRAPKETNYWESRTPNCIRSSSSSNLIYSTDKLSEQTFHRTKRGFCFKVSLRITAVTIHRNLEIRPQNHLRS